MRSLALVTAALAAFASCKDKSPRSDQPLRVRAPTAADLAAYTKDVPGSGKLMARIDTSMGALLCELFEKQTPVTVASFVGLARGLHPWRHPQSVEAFKEPYFDGLTFHRVMPNNFVQTGDPRGDGTGGPGYTFNAEIRAGLRHDRPGRMSMAHPPGRPHGNGSQFFITEVATPWLDGKHTVFGQCDGIELIKKITRVEKDPRDPTMTRPKSPITITKVTIHRAAER